MTWEVRDWLAANATEEDILKYRGSIPTGETIPFYTHEGLSVIQFTDYKYTREEARYRFADAMLEARKK